jgi:hypothetical protein
MVVVRLAASVAGMLALLALLGATPALAADYAYWYALPSVRIMRELRPSSPIRRASTVPTAPTLYFSAAQAEFEGRQIAIRPVSKVSNFVITASDLTQTGTDTPAVIPASEIEIDWVRYVPLRVRSYGTRVRVPGYYPDALPPTRLLNGTPIPRTMSAGATQPFYVLVHVPDGTPKGTYTGTLQLAASDTPTVTVPVSLRVWGFSVAGKSLRASFGFALRAAKYFAGPNHTWPKPWESPEAESTSFGGDSLNRWMKFFADHRISPQSLMPGFSTPDSNGTLIVRQEYVDDYSKTGGATTFAGNRLNFNMLPMPDRSLYYTYVDNPFSSSSSRTKWLNYFRSMRDAYGSSMNKAIVYSVDEPFSRDRWRVEYYGLYVHRYFPGTKYLVTVDPVRFRFKPLRNVDIYVHKQHFYYRDYYRWVRLLKRYRKQVWTYQHMTPHQAYTPLPLIDKPANDSRVLGWFAYKNAVPGVLYWSVNRWVNPFNQRYYRDPYRSTISCYLGNGSRRIYANGDGSLTYPGYYPALGLTIPGAGPVSSLRMEAIRDGLEDYEYLRILQSKKGRAYALRVVGRIISTRRFRHNRFPAYTTSPGQTQSMRDYVARAIEAAQ